MGTAGAELAGIVKTLSVGKGANYVVVNNRGRKKTASAGFLLLRQDH